MAACKLVIGGRGGYKNHPSLHSFIEGAVYIQIIRSSKSLCAITEAHDAPRNLRIL